MIVSLMHNDGGLNQKIRLYFSNYILHVYPRCLSLKPMSNLSNRIKFHWSNVMMLFVMMDLIKMFKLGVEI